MQEVTIIGGGPAGTVAALGLKRRGWRVTLLEQHQFPHDKVCGECISALGIDVLGRIGAHPAILAQSPVTLTHSAIHAPDGTFARVQLDRPMWGLSRRVLDSTLLNLAAAAGITIRQPMRCEKVDPAVEQRGFDRGIRRELPPTVHVRDLKSNQIETWKPDWVLLADGKGSLLQDRPARTRDFGIKAHFTGIDGPRDTIELFGVHGHYGGIAPIEADQWNVAFSVPAALLEQSGSNLDGLFTSIIQQNRSLAERFSKAKRSSDWLTAPLPRFAVARQWPAGVIPIGNAAAALEPIGGEGMGLAMRSGELAAAACGVQSIPALQESFNQLWRKRRTACRLAAHIVSRPWLANSSVAWLAADENLAQRVFRLLGKS